MCDVHDLYIERTHKFCFKRLLQVRKELNYSPRMLFLIPAQRRSSNNRSFERLLVLLLLQFYPRTYPIFWASHTSSPHKSGIPKILAKRRNSISSLKNTSPPCIRSMMATSCAMCNSLVVPDNGLM